tara:strand:+ start:260 stop:457 length:198 start_codon:yes stop_codon:yes gene_type:complete
MNILFGILFLLNIADPENIEFMEKTIDNNNKYECEFVYKGLSKPIDRPAITLYGYTLFKQECNDK